MLVYFHQNQTLMFVLYPRREYIFFFKKLQCNTDNRTNTKRKSTHKSRVFQDDDFYELQEAQLRYNEDDQCAQSKFRLQKVDRTNKGFLENALRLTNMVFISVSIYPCCLVSQ